MRMKQLWSHVDIPSKASLVWSRITFSRLTTVYFALACLHCVIQVIFQAQAFAINASAAMSLWSRIEAANQTQESAGFAVLGNDLRICYTVPSSINADSCPVIWGGMNNSSPSYGLAAVSGTARNPVANPVATPGVNGAVATLGAIATVSPSLPASPTALPLPNTPRPFTSASAPLSTLASAHPSRITIVIEPTPNARTQNPTTVVIAHDDDDDDELHFGRRDTRRSISIKRADNSNLDPICVKALIWPVQKLSNTKREDITFIGFQFWVLGMSFVALLNESIPHTMAALVTHLLATIWAIYQIFETAYFRRQFNMLITNGACKSHNLLGNYWDKRENAEISSAVLNSVALVASAFLTYKLVKIYGWQTFKRVGASLTINRIYRLVLSLSISIQLALFFIVSAMALWIDQLYNGSIGHLATEGNAYKSVFVVVFCLLIPWLSLGWFAVRRENRTMSLVFLILSLLFIGLWGAIFYSKTFRWTFVTWEFFTVMTITAGVLMISTFILGIACRVNFGKGLPRYLNAEEPLDGDDFAPVFPEKTGFGEDDPEKVEFPSSNGRPVPTFSATFGRGPEVPKPTQMRFGPARGPEMNMFGGATQEQQRVPGHAVGRSISSTSSHSARSEASSRNDNYPSHKSSSSVGSRSDGMGKRWVIE